MLLFGIKYVVQNCLHKYLPNEIVNENNPTDDAVDITRHFAHGDDAVTRQVN